MSAISKVMSKLVNLGSQTQKSLVECNDIGEPAINQSEAPKFCEADSENDWLKDVSNKKVGLGSNQLCDPMQTGQIINDVESPNRNTIYRYSKSLRGADEAAMDLFRNIVAIDEDGKAWPVPIIWGTQEKAVAAILQDNVRKDNSLVVDRIKLPMLAIHTSDIQFNQQRYIYHKALNYMSSLRTDGKPGFTTNEKYERDTIFGVARGIPVDISYTLYAWTLYIEDMNQILEQIITKFSPIAYIKVRGVPWEIGVKLDSIANNVDVEPGDQNIRVVKYQFNITAETYIPQPIVRKKAVLKQKISFFNHTNQEQINEVLDRLEVAVEDLKC